MAFWDRLKDLLAYAEKPAGAAAGLYGGAAKMIAGKNLDPEGQLGYDDPLEGLIKGWKKPEGAYRTMNKLYGDYSDVKGLEALVGGITDLGYDPLTMLAPIGGGSAALREVPVLGKIAEGANTAGKVGDLGALGKAGQYGRRYMTGLRLTGDPLSAIPVAGIQGAAERGAAGLAQSQALTNIMGKLPKLGKAGKAAATAAEEVAPLATEEAAQKVAGRVMPGARVATTPLQNMEQATGVANPTTLDLARSILPEAKPRAPKANPAPAVKMTAGQQMISDMIQRRNADAISIADIEAADAATIARRAPTSKTPKAPKANPPRGPNPNIAAGLGKPGGPQDLYRESIGPQLSESDMPGFLRRGAPTPQEAAIQKIVESKVAADFDDWRRAAIGPFTPTAASEGAMTPERLAYFMQNYGQ